MNLQQQTRGVGLFFLLTGLLGMALVLVLIYTATELRLVLFGPEIYFTLAGASLLFGSSNGLKRAQHASALAIVMGLGSAIGAPLFALAHDLSVPITLTTGLLGLALFTGAWICRRRLSGLSVSNQEDTAGGGYWGAVRILLVVTFLVYFLGSAYGLAQLMK